MSNKTAREAEVIPIINLGDSPNVCEGCIQCDKDLREHEAYITRILKDVWVVDGQYFHCPVVMVQSKEDPSLQEQYCMISYKVGAISHKDELPLELVEDMIDKIIHDLKKDVDPKTHMLVLNSAPRIERELLCNQKAKVKVSVRAVGVPLDYMLQKSYVVDA